MEISVKVKRLIKTVQYLLPFALSLALFSVIAAVNGLYPFGAKSISWCDMNQQAIPILCEYKDVLSGKANLFISYANAGGMNFYGLFVYYCTSPFNLLTVFVDKADMSLFMNVLVMLKIATATFTAYVYLQTKNGGRFSVLSYALSLLYGFSGYVMVYYQIVSWLDCVYMFPLFLLGLEKIDEGKSFILYSVTLAFSMVLSYYVTYMMVVYALVRFCAGYAFGYRDRKRAINFVLGSFFAALATAAVYIPVLVQYARSARTGTITEGLRNSAMITATDTTLLPVLCLSIILPFFLDATQRREERIDRLMVVLTAVPLFLEPVNKMWQTGSYMSFPSRYSFMLIFSVIAFVGKRFGGQKENYKIKSYVKWPAYGFLISGFIWAVIYTVKYSSANIGVLSKFSGTLWGSDESLTAFFRYYAVIITFSAALFAAYKFRLANETFIAAALLALVVNEAFFSAKPYMASPSHETDGYKSMMQAADLVPDEGFYRVNSKSKMFSGSDGVGINAVGAMGYNNLAHYTSLTSADYMNAVKQLGYSSYWMEVADYGGTKFSDAFLINKYTFVNSGLSSAKYSTEKYGLKENAVLPLGIAVYGDLSPVLQGERSDIAEQLYRDITGNSGLITKYPIQSAEFYGVEYSYENGVHTLKKEGEGAATVTVTAVVSGRQTLYFDCFDLYTNALRQHVNECFNVKVNGRTVAYNFPSQSNNGFLNLGEFEDATVKITLTLNKDFYGRSLGVFGESVLKVNEAVESFENAGFEVSGNKISGKITAAANGKLVFCLPYDEGYRFTVNGKRVKAEKVLTDFIAVPVEGGENVVKAVYIPGGFIAGTCVSLVGVAAFAVFVALGKKREYFIYSPFFEKTGRAFNILAFAVSSLAVIAVYVFPMILAML